MKMLKLLQEMRGFAELTNRRRIARDPALFTMQLRSHVLRATNTRRKHTILINMQEPHDIPHAVKIVHLVEKAGAAAVAPNVP